MSFFSSSNLRILLRLATSFAVLLPFIGTPFALPVQVEVMPLPTGQIDKSCRGLHAGIQTEFIKRDPSNNQTPFVMVSFVLLNDGDASEDTSTGSWTLVIDGKESSDSTMIFGNGPRPSGGWRILNPGESAQFAVALGVNRYFLESREYKLSWNGAGFQSPTITVTIPANSD